MRSSWLLVLYSLSLNFRQTTCDTRVDAPESKNLTKAPAVPSTVQPKQNWPYLAHKCMLSCKFDSLVTLIQIKRTHARKACLRCLVCPVPRCGDADADVNCYRFLRTTYLADQHAPKYNNRKYSLLVIRDGWMSRDGTGNRELHVRTYRTDE